MSAKDKFVHLHVHTEYSLLDGLSKIDDLFKHVKELGMDSVAMTDHGVLYGAIDFYKKAAKHEVKPIIGLEAYIVAGNMFEKNPNESRNHQLLLAKTTEGYKNLMELTSRAHVDGYYYKPRIDHETLKKYSKGIIATSTCMAGEIPEALINNDYDKAKKLLEWYLDVFGEDYYLEMQKHHYHDHAENAIHADIKRDLLQMSENEKKINEGVVKLSREFGVPLIATNDAHYIKKEDATAQDALVCVSTGKNVSDLKRLRFIDAPSYYITSPEEMSEKFIEVPEVMANTVKIAESCDVNITLGQYFFPKVDLEEGKTATEVLKENANEGLKTRFGKVTPELQERLDYELKIIDDKGYSAYFLIYQDMADWAHENKIPINTRGSAAGSLVSYSLKITTVDPIAYNLPFERFLNPLRPSAPDIDMDIADSKRDQMIDYLVSKYGEDKVAQICTFGRMLAKGSVRDVARVLGYPYEIGDNISKLIPEGAQGFPMTIKRALEESPELADSYAKSADTKKIIDLSKQIEGNARHISMHAAGVVISPTKLTDFTPLQSAEHNGVKKLITQYEMHAVEDVGLVKLDILGIRNLSILQDAVFLVEQTTGEEIDLINLNLEDKKTFEMLARGETMGVFQMAGGGMTKHLVELKPERIEDLMQMVALYRPGPMSFIPEYIKRKHNPKLVQYMDPRMEAFLASSYGILVYQDDVLYCAMELAGYDWGEVDKFRKAIGKKIPGEMQMQKDRFIEGCVKGGMPKSKAQDLFAQIETFAAYGFNKAHAASYGMVAYQTAFMKANYPVEFMTALMTAESGDTAKVSSAVAECRRMGIKVLPPDINESNVGFTVILDEESRDGKAIRFGLSAIKNVGVAAIEAILEARESSPFISIVDFLSRCDGRRVNKKVLESLIKVGALEKYGNRNAILTSLEELRAKVKPISSIEGQQGLFEEEDKKNAESTIAISQFVSDLPEFSDEELQDLERELLGFSLSGKPIEELLSEIMVHRSHTIEELTAPEFVSQEENIKIAGVVSEVRVVFTKKSNAEMAFVKFEDETGLVNLVVFPKIYAEIKTLLVDNFPLLISGKRDNRDGEINILANTIETAEAVKSKEGKFFITVPKNVPTETLKELKQILEDYPGNQSVALVFEGNDRDPIDVPFKVSWNKELSQEINKLFEKYSGSSVQ